MSTNQDDIARPVRLSPRSTQGIILGLDAWQSVFLVSTFATLLVFVQRLGPIGLIAGLPVYVPLAVIAFVRVHRMPLPRWWWLLLVKKGRTMMRANKETFRPEASRKAGTLRLPGRLGAVQMWDVDGMAVVYNPHGKTATIMVELEVPGFLMKDLTERYDLAERFAHVLASFTQRTGIKRVTLQERTTPATIQVARDYYLQHQGEIRVESAQARYEEVMDVAEQYAVAHRNYLTLTFDLMALGAQLKALGGGKTAIERLCTVEASNVSSALRGAEFDVRRWLSLRDVGALARTAFDPDSVPILENRTGEDRGVDLAAMGPTYLEEPNGNNAIVRTDSGVHTTMWIHEWPRAAAPVGFVDSLVFARHPVDHTAISHIFTAVLTPVPVSAALKRIRQDKKVWRSNERLRAKRGQDGSAVDAADYAALEEQERSLVDGHGEFRYGGYLTITGRNDTDLEQAVAGIRNALSRAGMEGQILYAQQAEALLVNALPIGLGMK